MLARLEMKLEKSRQDILPDVFSISWSTDGITSQGIWRKTSFIKAASIYQHLEIRDGEWY